MSDLNRATRIVDVHAHALLAAYLRGLAEQGVDPVAEDGFPTPACSPDAAADFAQQVGIGYSILSISTPHVHRGDDAVAARICREVNDELSKVCAANPERWGFSALLPLPSVKESIAEVRRAYDELGAKGVKVPSNAHGVYLGDPCLESLMVELDAHEAVVTIHPSVAPAIPQNTFTAGAAPLFEYLADTTRAVLNLMATGTLERYPHVRWIVPHCGSFLPEVAHRLAGIQKVLVPAGMMQPVDVEKSLRSLYFDLAGDALPVMLSALLKVADPSHLLYGSDYPYTPAPLAAAKLRALREAPELEGILDNVLFGNAARLYGLDF